METAIAKILEAALLAPSADNTQPWKIWILGDDTIELFHVPERDIAPYDSFPRPSLMAHGAFIENAYIAASYLGHTLSINLDTPNQTNRWRVATLTVTEGKKDTAAASLYPYIQNRLTNRKPYDTVPLTGEQKEDVLSCSNSFEHQVKILDYPQPELARAVSVTEQISFQNLEVHKNLFRNIRWTKDEIKRTKDGFSIKTFELPKPGEIVFRIARNWKRLSFLNRVIGLAGTIPSQTSKLYEQAGSYIAITGSTRTPQDFIEAGRIMQRIWLTLTKHEKSVQPIGALLFFKLGVDNKTTSVFSSHDIDLIHQASDTITEIVGPEQERKVLFLLRTGTSDAPSERTIRLHLSDILMT